MTPHSLAFYVDVVTTGTVLGVGPEASPDRVTAVLGPDFAENAFGAGSMFRDYGLAEFFWDRPSAEQPWSGHHFTLQVFFEFMDAAMSWTSDDETVRLPATRVQPIATAEVVQTLADVATAQPLDGTLNVAGPDVYRLDELGRLTLSAREDRRTVVTDDEAGMFASVDADVLVAGPDARVAATHYEDWLGGSR